MGACGLFQLYGNPIGESVNHGQATFQRQGNDLIIRQSSDRAVIGWRDFSIKAGETTRFVQPTARSSALNRVYGGQRSLLDGRIEANGQVILINPNGITVGPSGSVQAQSFIGSTLNLPNEEFLSEKGMTFKGDGDSEFINHGTIHATGGDAVIVSRRITNTGTIEAPHGTAGLAAGSEVLIQPQKDQLIYIKPGSAAGTISHSGSIRAAAAEIQASGNPYSAGINLEGWVSATGTSTRKGQVRVVSGGPVKIRGQIQARNADGTGGAIAVRGSDLTVQNAHLNASGTTGGRITLAATAPLGNVTVTASELRAEGNTGAGGQIGISGNVITLDSLISASGRTHGGQIFVSAGDLQLSGQLLATGTTGFGGAIGIKVTRLSLEAPGSVVKASGGLGGGLIRHIAELGITSSGSYIADSAHGAGGSVAVTAPTVTLTGAQFEVSGATGGGTLRVGGNFQGGRNLPANDLPNAQVLIADGATSFRANGRGLGAPGGRIVLWADGHTTVNSTLLATPGLGGLGGSLEVSSGNLLQFGGAANAGHGGAVLFDPKDIVVSLLGVNGLPQTYGTGGLLPVTLTPATITAILNTGTAVTLQANNDISVLAPITANNPGGAGGALTLQAGRSILVSANLTTDNGNLTLIANDTLARGVNASARDLGAGAITFLLGAAANAGTGAVTLLVETGSGGLLATSGDIVTGPITAGIVSITNAGLTAGSDIVVNGNVQATGNLAVTGTGNITWNAALNYNGNGGGKIFAVRAAGDIALTGSASDGTAGGGDNLAIILNSDRDASGSGSITLTGANLQSQGGTIILGGGSGNPATSGTAISTGLLGAGVAISTSTLNSAGGDLIVRGAYSGLGANAGVSVVSSSLSSGAGALGLAGQGSGIGTGIQGVLVNATNLTATTGQIAITGASTATGLGGEGGVHLTGLGTLSTTTGAVTLTGSGSAAGGLGGAHRGVTVDALYTVATTGGDLTVTGTGGGLTGVLNSENDGILLGLASLRTTGSGHLTLQGTGGGAGAGLGNNGLDIGLGGIVQTVAGVQSLTATGGLGLGTGNDAVALAGTITSQTGAINLAATARQVAGNASSGLSGLGGVIEATGNAPITITAVGGPVAGVGLNAGLGALRIGSPTASGNITLNTDRIALEGLGTALQGTGNLIIQPITAGTSIGLGGLLPTGTLNLSALELLKIGNNFHLVTIGNAASGAIDLEGATLGLNLRLRNALDLVVGDVLSNVGGLLWIDSAGGNVTQNAAINAAQLLLTGVGNFTLNATGNIIGTLAANVTGNLQVVANTGITVGTVTQGTTVSGITSTGGVVQLIANGIGSDITLLNGITATGTGTTIQLVAGGNFINSANATLNAGAGRFLVWSTTPLNDVRGGLSYAFKQYGAVVGSTLPAQGGNGFLYNLVPALTANLVGTVSKVYDGTVNAPVTPGNFSVTGLIDGDVAALVGVGSTATFGDPNVGLLKSVTAANIVLPTVKDGTANVYGYTLASATATALIGQITAATATVSLTGNATKVYDGNTNAVISTGAVVTLNGILGADAVTLNVPLSGQYDTKNVGTGKLVTILGVSLQGAAAGNYVLASANVSAAIGTITPATITATLTGPVTKVYDTTRTATLTAGNFTANGAITGDSLTLTTPLAGLYDTRNVGVNKLVIASGLSLSGADAGNYVLASTTASGAVGVITPASVSATLTGTVTKVYDGTVVATFGAGNLALAGTLGGDTVILTAPQGGTYDTRNVGTGKLVTATGLVLIGADAGNYVLTSGTVSAQNGTITAAPITVTITGGIGGTVTKVYDTTTTATVAPGGVTLGGLVTGDDVTLNPTLTATYDNKNVGTGKLVTLTGLGLIGADAANYTLTATSSTAAIGVITPASLSVTLIGATSKVYDGNTAATLNSGNFTLTGTLGADVVALTAPQGGTYDDKNVGTGKLVTATGLLLTGIDAGNYTLGGGTISGAIGAITPASLTVVLTGGAGGGGTITKVYDTTTAATVTPGNYTFTGLVTGDAVTVTPPTSAVYDDKNVGTGKTVTITGLGLTGDDAGNYTLTSPTVTAAVGVITPATITAGLTGSVSKVYDGTTAAPIIAANYSVTGILAADVVALNNPAAGLFDNKNVGTGKLVTVNGLALLGTDAGNYVLASTSASAAIGTITSAALTASLNASLTGTVAKTYDGTTTATLAAGNYRLTGFAAGDLVGLNNPTLGLYDTKDVGTGKLVTVNGLTLTGADAGNYTLDETTISGNVGVITPASLSTGLTGSVTKVYDGTRTAALAAGNLQLTGLVGGETVTVSATAATFATKDVATGKLVTATGLTLSGADAGNYVLVSATASGAIGQITPLTLSATLNGPVTKTYDATTTASLTAGNVSLSGVLAGDAVGLGGTLTGTFADKNVGTGKVVTIASLTLAGLDAGNYVLAANGASAAVGQITPATVSVTLQGPITKTYDTTTTATLGAGNYGVTGLFAGDDVALNKPTVGTFDNRNAGTGKLVSVGGLALLGGDAGNYTLASAGASAAVGQISPASLTVSLTGTVMKTYDGNTSAPLTGGQFQLTGVLGSDAVAVLNSTGTFDNKNVGTGKVVSVSGLLLGGADGGNYVVTSASTSAAIGSISPATVTIGPGGVVKSYDGTTHAPGVGGYVLSGVFGQDDLGVTAATGSYANPNVSANQGQGLVTLSTVTLGGADAGNYVFDETALGTPRAIGRIVPAALEVKAQDRTKPFGQAISWNGTEFTVTGLQNGETASLATISSPGAAAGAEPDGGMTFPINVTDLRGGTFDPTNYQLTYTTGALTVTGFTPPVQRRRVIDRPAGLALAQSVIPRVMRFFSVNYTYEAAFRADEPTSWRNFLPERVGTFSHDRMVSLDLDERAYAAALKRWGWQPKATLFPSDAEYVVPLLSL